MRFNCTCNNARRRRSSSRFGVLIILHLAHLRFVSFLPGHHQVSAPRTHECEQYNSPPLPIRRRVTPHNGSTRLRCIGAWPTRSLIDSKGCDVGWGATMAVSLAGEPHGITVNALSPGAYTRMSKSYLDGQGIPVGLDLTPARVAEVAVGLCTEAGRHYRQSLTYRRWPYSRVVWTTPIWSSGCANTCTHMSPVTHRLEALPK